MTGKKFSAAEKHFLEKEIKYRKDIEYKISKINKLEQEISDLRTERNNLSAENLELRDWVERLLTYTELDVRDIKKVCEKEKATANVMQSLSEMLAFGCVRV